MSRITIDLGSKILICRRQNTQRTCNQSRAAVFEQLCEPVVLSVTASFAPDTGVLSVFGDNPSNNIVVSRDAAGHILIDGGAISVTGGAPIVIGQSGNDKISLEEVNGVLA